MDKDIFGNLNKGQLYADKRHAARLATRRSLSRLIAQLSADMPRELALNVMVESAVGFLAWGQNDPSETSRKVSRLARRVGNGEQIEM